MIAASERSQCGRLVGFRELEDQCSHVVMGDQTLAVYCGFLHSLSGYLSNGSTFGGGSRYSKGAEWYDRTTRDDFKTQKWAFS
jgi:hypothetical protein